METLLKKGDNVVGLDIGGTKMMAVVLGRKGVPKGRCRTRSQSAKPDEKAEDHIIRVIQEAINDAGSPKIKGIGVGSPGPTDSEAGVIIDTPNLGWKNFPLGELLSAAFKVPVVIENDVNMGTYGEWRFGKLNKYNDVVGIFPGTGIGGGIIINGKLLHGASGAAGEIGHMTIDVDGPYCGCGKRGCLEAVASRIAIAKEVAALAARGDAPFIAENCGTDIRNIRSGILAQAIKAGESQVENVVRKAAYYVGIAVGNLINVLSPEAVVLGGGMVEAMEALFLDEVKRGVRDHAMPFLRKNVTIVPATLGDDAVVLGAARMIAEKLAR